MRAQAGRRHSDATVSKWWRAYAAVDFIELDDKEAFHLDTTLEETRSLFGRFSADVERMRAVLANPQQGIERAASAFGSWDSGNDLQLLMCNLAQLAEAVEWGARGASVRALRKLARKHLSRCSSATEEQIRTNIDRVLVDGGVK